MPLLFKPNGFSSLTTISCLYGVCGQLTISEGKENIIDLTKAETYDLAIDGGSGHQDIEYQILVSNGVSVCSYKLFYNSNNLH